MAHHDYENSVIILQYNTVFYTSILAELYWERNKGNWNKIIWKIPVVKSRIIQYDTRINIFFNVVGIDNNKQNRNITITYTIVMKNIVKCTSKCAHLSLIWLV